VSFHNECICTFSPEVKTGFPFGGVTGFELIVNINAKRPVLVEQQRLRLSNPESIAERIARVDAKVRSRAMRVGECISSADLIEFEKRYEISLPDGYREFVLRIGNGAPGPPAYGLIELAEPPIGRADYRAHTRQTLASMKKLFPFTKPWVWEGGDLSDEGTDDQVGNGQLYLGTDGCGMDWSLIVTGPERGNIWWVCGEGLQPTSPKRDFLRWFEDWLDGVRDWWEPRHQGA
jgi:SMI1 / KNR4 family (SUKH-1)